MPTALTHPAVPLAIALGLGEHIVSKRLLAAGVVASMLPDLDVLAFRFGIPYAAEWGHRGFSHSVLFALMVAVAGAGVAQTLHSTARMTFLFLLVVTAVHESIIWSKSVTIF